jgi:hypothetical protein
MINFDTDNIVLVCYPGFAGGKFLINSLGLSNNAVFQNDRLAEQQLNGDFTPKDKFTLLQQRLAEPMENWTDLNLGCEQLFGVDTIDYQRFLTARLLNNDRFHPVIDQLSNGNHKFFLVVHFAEYLDRILRVWKNAQVILFDNYTKFTESRYPVNPDIERIWQDVRGDSWPTTAPKTLLEFSKMEMKYQIEIKSNFPYLYRIMLKDHKDLVYIQSTVDDYKTDQTIMWDTSLYYDRDATVNGIEQLYQQLGLTDFKKEYVADYYDQWIDKLYKLGSDKEQPGGIK